ncbi:hypothetical protein LOTGIDRAFT_174762 [Lottia gigantea]|uniref:Uncharacterized protein n=1 Tax=Lottia gigantea TaxID=225164 RepID=V4C4Z2_LOTGI|nr:hypothetical protein LOTGIDRAFT_174762 [Lottia gigantea]ESO96659.1 hypothetical protein LOTGIDRAFT_174762 [Lottia gigantea]
MASVSPWNSKIPGNRRLSDDKDSVVMSSSWSRSVGEKSSDGLSVNSNINIDSSNSQDFNNSNKNIVNHRNFNGNSETDAVDKHNLVSITENPFFKSYGKIRAPHTRNEYRAERERNHTDSSPLSPKVFSDNISTSNSLQQEDEEEVEYHPGSGFVTKLLGKFKMKYEKEERAYSQPVPIKRSSSLENILDNQPVASSVKLMRSVKNDHVSSVIGQSNLNYRTKSVEHINSTNKPVPGKRAPDVKLARKDIVIIESSKSGKVSPTPTQPTNHIRSGSVSPTISTTTLRDETPEVDELPKPNTVTNTRHLFESTPRSGSKSRAAPAPPRPSSSAGTRISTVAPTKNISAPITTSAHSNKPNHSQKPKDVVSTKSTTDAPLPRSTLPPVTNRNKKPSPVVTVAPYKPKSDENYSTTTSATIPLPQKPLTTPRNGDMSTDKKPLQPTTNQNFISTPRDIKDEKVHQETKSEKIIEKPDIKSEVKTQKDSVKISEEIILKKSEDKIVTKNQIKNTNISEMKVIEDKVDKSDSQSEPVKGIPTIIAQRMKKETSPDSVVTNGSQVSSQSSKSELYNSGSNDISSKKRQAPAIPKSGVITMETKKEVPEKEEISPRQNLHHAQKKSQDIGGPAMVFDSSMVAKKKRKPNYSTTTNNVGVPKLDLTGINDNVGRHGYQEGYKPTEIKPCKIIFIGALVDLGRSLLKKDGQSSTKTL